MIRAIVLCAVCVTAGAALAQDSTVIGPPVECDTCGVPSGDNNELGRLRNTFYNVCIGEANGDHPCNVFHDATNATQNEMVWQGTVVSTQEGVEVEKGVWVKSKYRTAQVCIDFPVPFIEPDPGYCFAAGSLESVTLTMIDHEGTPRSWTYPAGAGRLPTTPPQFPYPPGHPRYVEPTGGSIGPPLPHPGTCPPGHEMP